MLHTEEILCQTPQWTTLLNGAEYESVEKDQDSLLRMWLVDELMEHFHIPRCEMHFELDNGQVRVWQRVDGALSRGPFVPEKNSLFGWEKDSSSHRFLARLHRFCSVFSYHSTGVEMLPVFWKLTPEGRGVPVALPSERFFQMQPPEAKRLTFLTEKNRREAMEDLRELNNEMLEAKIFHFFSRTAHLWSINPELMREKVLMLSMNHRYATF